MILIIVENHHHCHNKTAVASWEARDKGLSPAFRFKYSGAACDDPLFANTLHHQHHHHHHPCHRFIIIVLMSLSSGNTIEQITDEAENQHVSVESLNPLPINVFAMLAAFCVHSVLSRAKREGLQSSPSAKSINILCNQVGITISNTSEPKHNILQGNFFVINCILTRLA